MYYQPSIWEYFWIDWTTETKQILVWKTDNWDRGPIYCQKRKNII